MTRTLLTAALAAVALVATAPVAAAAPSDGVLAAGGTLAAGEALAAPDGSHRLVMQTDGNLVLYTASDRPLWSSRTSGAGLRLVVQGDGNAVVYTPAGAAAWASRTSGSGVRLVVQGDGNAVLYSSSDRPLWASASDRPRDGVLPPGTVLHAGEDVHSPDGGHRLLVQGDGNVVLYGPAGPRWSTRTGTAGSRLVMQEDGNLVVYSGDHRPLWDSRSGGASGARAVVQDDGNLVVYRPDGVPVFASASERPLVRTFTYSVRSRGTLGTDLEEFARHAADTLRDRRGWALDGALAYVRVPSGGDFTLWLAEASTLPSFSPVCSSSWSCRAGRDVVINDMRWRGGTPSWTLGLDAYRHYVVNHELGHWLGLGHLSCPGPGQPAPVMQQQSISLQGCAATVWPLAHERSTVARRYGA